MIKKFFIKLTSLGPGELLQILKAFTVGSLYCLYYNNLTKNVRIGFPFFVYAPFKITGSGTIIIGKRCNILYNVFRGVHLATLSPQALIHIGEMAFLGGATIRSRNKIIIKNNLLAAFTLIQDYMFSFPATEENNSESTEIYIGNHVWLGGQTCVLGGSSIDDNCVLTMGTVTKSAFKKNYIISGNPAKRGIPLDLFLRNASC